MNTKYNLKYLLGTYEFLLKILELDHRFTVWRDKHVRVLTKLIAFLFKKLRLWHHVSANQT